MGTRRKKKKKLENSKYDRERQDLRICMGAWGRPVRGLWGNYKAERIEERHEGVRVRKEAETHHGGGDCSGNMVRVRKNVLARWRAWLAAAPPTATIRVDARCH